MQLIDVTEVLRRLDILILALDCCNVTHVNDTRLEVVKAIRQFIADQPTVDAVPVVRCGECKHRIDVDYANGHACLRRSSYYYCEDNDFCSYGEQRADNA